MSELLQRRISWPDVAKGIGILLVLLGHAPIPLSLKLYIYAFHMPLFFMLAGLFFKPGASFTEFIRDKASRLLLPYLFFSTLSYGIWMGLRNFSKLALTINPETPLMGIIFGIGSGNWMTHNTPLWFLPCMFVTLTLLFAGAKLFQQRKKLLLVFIGLLSVGGYAAAQALEPRLPWSLDVAMTAIVFTGLGYLFRKRLLSSTPLPALTLLLLTVIWIACTYFNSDLVSMVDMNNERLGNYFLFYFAAGSGILLVVDLAKRLSGIAVLAYIGARSLPVFCMHMLVYLMVTAIGKKVFHVPLALTYEHLMKTNPHANAFLVILAYTIPGLLLPLLILKIYDRVKEIYQNHIFQPKSHSSDMLASEGS